MIKKIKINNKNLYRETQIKNHQNFEKINQKTLIKNHKNFDKNLSRNLDKK